MLTIRILVQKVLKIGFFLFRNVNFIDILIFTSSWFRESSEKDGFFSNQESREKENGGEVKSAEMAGNKETSVRENGAKWGKQYLNK